jgi:uncharacterized phiE125 gp8 family phage protein
MASDGEGRKVTHRTPKIISVEGDEPISIEEARAHLEAQPYEDSDVDPIDDTMIEGWLMAAREYCENFLGLSLTTRTLEIALDSFPTSTSIGGVLIELPMGPVRDVISVSWGDDSDAELAAADLALDTYRRPNALKPVAAAWPSVTAATNAVKVRYLAGYGVDSDGGEAMPKVIRSAILLVLGHLYRNREDTTEQALSSIPVGATSLMRPLRVRLGMA